MPALAGAGTGSARREPAAEGSVRLLVPRTDYELCQHGAQRARRGAGVVESEARLTDPEPRLAQV